MTRLVESVLSFLFPVKLPRAVVRQTAPASYDPVLTPLNMMEHGCGNAQPKPYRDGIARHFAETRVCDFCRQPRDETHDEQACYRALCQIVDINLARKRHV
jgi:hypothetical protein